MCTLEVDQRHFRNENLKLNQTIHTLERDMLHKLGTLDGNFGTIPIRLDKIETISGQSSLKSSSLGINSFNELFSKCKNLKNEIMILKKSNTSKHVSFQGLDMRDLKDVKDWLEQELPSMNHTLIVDTHGLF